MRNRIGKGTLNRVHVITLCLVCATFFNNCKKNKEKSTVEATKKTILEKDEARLKPVLIAPSKESLVVDPFCGMKLLKEEAAGTYNYKGTTYYFCSKDHMEAFMENPEEYLNIDKKENE